MLMYKSNKICFIRSGERSQLNTWTNVSCSCIGILTIIKILASPNLIYRVNIIPRSYFVVITTVLTTVITVVIITK